MTSMVELGTDFTLPVRSTQTLCCLVYWGIFLPYNMLLWKDFEIIRAKHVLSSHHRSEMTFVSPAVYKEFLPHSHS